MTSPTAALLTKAADRIERDGLHKGGYFEGYDPTEIFPQEAATQIFKNRETPAVDIFGALHLESRNDMEIMLAAQAVATVVGIDPDEWSAPLDLVNWCDIAERTQAEVVEALRKAAIFERESE